MSWVDLQPTQLEGALRVAYGELPGFSVRCLPYAICFSDLDINPGHIQHNSL